MVSSQAVTDIERQVLDTDARRVKALISNDIPVLEEIFADDLTYVHTSARLDTKESLLAGLRAGTTRYLAMDMKDLKVRPYGDTAVVTGTFAARVQVRGQEGNPTPRVLMVYVKRGGRWQLVAWQTTNIPTS